jgi:hypothetical protein
MASKKLMPEKEIILFLLEALNIKIEGKELCKSL